MIRAMSRPKLLVGISILAVILTTATLANRYCNRTHVRIQQAIIALSASQPERALAMVNSILDEQPNHIEALQVKARALSGLHRPREEADILNRLILLQPEVENHHDNLVKWTFRHMEQLLTHPTFRMDPQLQTEFDQALATGAKQAQWFHDKQPAGVAARFLFARYAMADVYRLRTMEADWTQIVDRLDHAKHDLQTVTTTDPNHQAARYLLGQVCLQKGEFTEARTLLTRLIADQPTSVQIKTTLIKTLIRMNDLKSAQTELRSVMELAPRDPEVLSLAMELGRRANDHAAVRKLVDTIRQIAPLSDAHRIVLADGLLFSQIPSEERELRRILAHLQERYPANASVNVLRAEFYLQRNRFDMAADIAARICRTEPDNRRARMMLAQSLAGMNRIDDALTEFDKIPLDGSVNPLIHAQIDLAKGEGSTAEAICSSALDSDTRNPAMRLLMAVVSARQNDEESTSHHLEMFIRNQPNNPAGYALLSRYYLARNKAGRGIEHLQELEVFNEPLACMAEAWLMVKTQRDDEALARLTRVRDRLLADRDPMALAVTTAIAAIYAKQHRVSQAIKAYDPLIDADLCTTEAKIHQWDLAPWAEQLDVLARDVDIHQPRLVYSLLIRYDRLGLYTRALDLLERWIQERPDQAILLEWMGKFLLKLNRQDAAAKAFQAAIKLEPENMSLWQGLVQCHLTTLDFPKAEAIYRAMANVDPAARVHALAELARVYVVLGLTEQAEDTLRELQNTAPPRDPHVLLTLGQVCAALGHQDQARSYLEQLPGSAPRQSPNTTLANRLGSFE